MGKARALKLGIVKGVKHSIDQVRPDKIIDRALVSRAIGSLRCTACGHASDSHKRRRPPFVDWPAEKMWEEIQKTGSRGSGGFLECAFYFCDNCETDIVEDERHRRSGKPFLEDCPC